MQVLFFERLYWYEFPTDFFKLGFYTSYKEKLFDRTYDSRLEDFAIVFLSIRSRVTFKQTPPHSSPLIPTSLVSCWTLGPVRRPSHASLGRCSRRPCSTDGCPCSGAPSAHPGCRTVRGGVQERLPPAGGHSAVGGCRSRQLGIAVSALRLVYGRYPVIFQLVEAFGARARGRHRPPALPRIAEEGCARNLHPFGTLFVFGRPWFCMG